MAAPLFRIWATIAMLAALSESAVAQDYPTRPVRLNVPAPRGLMLDVTIAGHDGRQLLAA